MRKTYSKEKLKSSNLMQYYNNIKDKYQNKYKNDLTQNNNNSIRNKSNDKKYCYNKQKKSSDNLNEINQNDINKNQIMINNVTNNTYNIVNNKIRGIENYNTNFNGTNSIKKDLEEKKTTFNKNRKNNLSYSGSIGTLINPQLELSEKKNKKELSNRADIPSEANYQNSNHDCISVNNYNFTMSKNFDENYKNASENSDKDSKIKRVNDNYKNYEKTTDNNSNRLVNFRADFNSKISSSENNHNLPNQIKINNSRYKIHYSDNKSPIGLHKSNNQNNYSKNKNSKVVNMMSYNSNKNSAYKSNGNKTDKSSEIAIKFDMINNSFSENNHESNKNIENFNNRGKIDIKDENDSNYEKCNLFFSI